MLIGDRLPARVMKDVPQFCELNLHWKVNTRFHIGFKFLMSKGGGVKFFKIPLIGDSSDLGLESSLFIR